MKGILLAGGSGSRLYPVTQAVSKQLVPVYDKPMIYYPLSTLMSAGVHEILIITTPGDRSAFERLLGDGEQFGVQLSFEEQAEPRGIAEALIIGRDFVGDDRVVLALGDNVFHGHGLRDFLREAANRIVGATIFGYRVIDPTQYGVVEFDEEGRATNLVEKPKSPRSPFAVPGLYFYDSSAIDIASKLVPSPRGELEITDVNLEYLRRGELHVIRLGRGIAWLDTGTHEALLQASNFIQAIEARQGLKVACLEEVAYREGFVDREHILRVAAAMNNEYGNYILRSLEEDL